MREFVAGQELRAGVAGAGVFGGFHARKYASLDGVRLVAVFDPDADQGSYIGSAPLCGNARQAGA